MDELFSDTMLRRDEIENLTGIYDLERLMTRIAYGTANARELRSLSAAIEKLAPLRARLEGCKSAMLCEIFRDIDPLEDLFALVDSAIVEEPPFTVREGGMIKPGFHEELDTLHALVTDGKGFLAQIEQREQERTGIKKLKIGYNRVFGYYIEVSNSYKELVPEDYIRKQTLANAERYTTPRLKELEDTGWIVRKFSGFLKPKHIYVLIPGEKDLCAGELRKWPGMNATANGAEKEPSDGYRCGLSKGINMAPSKVNKKEEFNNNYGVRRQTEKKRISLNVKNYDCGEEESL